MVNFIAVRLMHGAIAVFFLMLLVFFLSSAAGDPLALLVPPGVSPEVEANIIRGLGLDQPLSTQFVIYVRDVLGGDLGTSFVTGRSVSEMIWDRLPASLRLIGPATALSVILGVTLGVVAAVSPSRTVRRSLETFAAVTMAAPAFWIALVLIWIFAVNLGILPTSRFGGFRHHILPIATLTLAMTPSFLRAMRSSILDVLGEEYIKMARLKGVSERMVIAKHALKNALSSTVSLTAIYLSVLVTGSVTLEMVFSWPGVGFMTYQALLQRDFPVIRGVVIVSGIGIVLVTLLADLIQVSLDRRIRL